MDTDSKTTIKLNGQSYDAKSGLPLNHALSLDGVLSGPSAHESHTTLSAKHHLKHPAAARTLMRQGVAKPSKSARQIEGVSLALSPLKRSSLIEAPVMATRIDSKLAQRAKSFKPSGQISRFGATLRSASTETPSTSHDGLAVERVKSIAKPVGASLLEKAVANAHSHEQPKLGKKELRATRTKHPRRGHRAAYATVGLMALVVIAYAVYANIPNVMVKVASVRAGFSAVLPSYRPSGFSMSAVGYRAGVVRFNFTSNSDHRQFSLSEHSSSWDSATLVSSVIVPTQGQNYQRLTLDGQTVYLFGKDQAAWVSNGIWYQVSGNGALSTAQILKLATTL